MARGTGVRPVREVILLLVLALAVVASGCHMPGVFFAWLAAPRHPKKTIEAEYELESERMVIVVYAGTDTLFKYPTAPLEVSYDLVNEVCLHLSPRVKTVVGPVDVVRWQESNLEWPNMTLDDIAKAFQADTVLYVELEQYSMIEERSANLLRGRVNGRVQVAKVDAERNPTFEATVSTVFPEDRQVGMLQDSERKLRAITTRMFARDVVRKFHGYEVEVQGGAK